jgi:hypothetical protein
LRALKSQGATPTRTSFFAHCRGALNALWCSCSCGFCKPNSASAHKEQSNRMLDFERAVLAKHATAALPPLLFVSSRPWLHSHVPCAAHRAPMPIICAQATQTKVVRFRTFKRAAPAASVSFSSSCVEFRWFCVRPPLLSNGENVVRGTCKGRRPRRRQSPAGMHTPARTAASRVRTAEWDRKGGNTARRAQACPRPPAMHVHRHCPRYAPPRAHLTRAVDEWHTDATTAEARDRLGRTRCGGYTTTPWATAAAPLWRRRSRVMSCVLRDTPSGKRHASCGGAWARAYAQEADRRPGRRWRPAERERRRRQRRRRRAYSPHEMTAPRRRVATSSLVQQNQGPVGP